MKSHDLAQIIVSRPRDLGGFSVRRLIPAIGRKMVGPFIFFDHMGPKVFDPGTGMDVRPHPHINLATVTYLFEGAIHHRDSLGSSQIIQPGDINWMTAGRGIVHSERTPQHLRSSGGRLSGIQCWVALPKDREEIEPSFIHHAQEALPLFEREGVSMRLLVGSAFGKESPVGIFSDMMYLDVRMAAGSTLPVPAKQREMGAYIVQGSVSIAGQDVSESSLAIGHVGQDLQIEAKSAAHLMLIGGTPLGEEREIWWNFVSSSKERIARAKSDWAAGRFPTIPGDDGEFIPLPKD